MNKQTQTPEIKSLKDAAYRWATVGESADSVARYVIDVCPGFLDEVPTEIKSELFAGFQLRKHELEGEKFYKLADGGHFIPVEKPAKDATGIVCMTVNAAMSYSAQEFGKLKDKDPAMHGIVKPMRDKFSTYASNSLRDLKAKIKRILTADKPRERAANKGFIESLQAVFDSYEKRCKTAKDRGDNDADLAKYKAAVSAFWRCYNQQPQ